MGVNTDATAPPFQPLPPEPGVPPSGIGKHPDIRGMANRARKRVSPQRVAFTNPGIDSASIPGIAPTPALTAQQQYVKAGAALDTLQVNIDNFLDWILFR